MHSIALGPTVTGTKGYRRGLASRSVVKEPLFRVHRNVPIGRLTAALQNLTALRSRQINWLGACLVGLIQPRCATSTSSFAYLSFRGVLASSLRAMRLSAEISHGTFRNQLI